MHCVEQGASNMHGGEGSLIVPKVTVEEEEAGEPPGGDTSALHWYLKGSSDTDLKMGPRDSRLPVISEFSSVKMMMEEEKMAAE